MTQHIFRENVVAWLQQFLQSNETDMSRLLLEEKMRQAKVTTLEDLFETMLQGQGIIKKNFCWIRRSLEEQTTFYLELMKSDEIVIKRLELPLYGQRSFEQTPTDEMLQFFEQALNSLAEIYEAETNVSLEQTILVNDEEEQQMFSKLNLKRTVETPAEPVQPVAETFVTTHDVKGEDLLGRELVSEETLSGEMFFEATDFERQASTQSESQATETDMLDEQEDEEVEVAYEEIYDEVFADEDEEEVNEGAVLDFEQLNADLTVLFKESADEERVALKQLKADLWALEMSDEPLTEAQVQAFIESILMVETEAVNVLKWQVATARQLFAAN